MTSTPSYKFTKGIWELDLHPILDGYKKHWEKEEFFKDMGMDWDVDVENLKYLYDSGCLFTVVAYDGDNLLGAYVGALTPYICDKKKVHCYELLWFTDCKDKTFTKDFFTAIDSHLKEAGVHSMALAYPKENSALMKKFGYTKTKPMYMKRI